MQPAAPVVAGLGTRTAEADAMTRPSLISFLSLVLISLAAYMLLTHESARPLLNRLFAPPPLEDRATIIIRNNHAVSVIMRRVDEPGAVAVILEPGQTLTFSDTPERHDQILGAFGKFDVVVSADAPDVELEFSTLDGEPVGRVALPVRGLQVYRPWQICVASAGLPGSRADYGSFSRLGACFW